MDPRVEEERLRKLRVAAREDERRRWARELHDETLQALGALRVQLSAARGCSDVGSLRSALEGAVDELGREIANLRALITELRPASLDELGLEPALEQLFERAWTVHGLSLRTKVELDPGQPMRLDTDLETAVYRIVQESITNAARHAHAQRVEVTVIERAGEITVAVSDDGCGFDPSAPSAGFGLTGMRERASLAGGRLHIRTSEQGTAILARLPAVRRAAVAQLAG